MGWLLLAGIAAAIYYSSKSVDVPLPGIFPPGSDPESVNPDLSIQREPSPDAGIFPPGSDPESVNPDLSIQREPQAEYAPANPDQSLNGGDEMNALLLALGGYVAYKVLTGKNDEPQPQPPPPEHYGFNDPIFPGNEIVVTSPPPVDTSSNYNPSASTGVGTNTYAQMWGEAPPQELIQYDAAGIESGERGYNASIVAMNVKSGLWDRSVVDHFLYWMKQRLNSLSDSSFAVYGGKQAYWDMITSQLAGL